MHKNQIRRRRATALALFGLSIVFLTIYFGEPASGALHAVQRGAMEVISPFQRLASGAIKPARDLVNWVGDSFDAKSKNEQLERDLLDARVRLARLSLAEAENSQLRKLADFDKSDAYPAGVRSVGARVIVRSPNAWYARITINKGRSSGVRVNQAVMGAQSGTQGGGLIGRVTSVAPHVAQVTLLTSAGSGVAGLVPGRRVLGVVRSRGGGEATANDLLLDFIQQRTELRPGDQVVTAGTVADPSEVRSVFPAGIPIGQVTKVDAEERNLFQRVHMSPYVDMRDLLLVQVLVKEPSR